MAYTQSRAVEAGSAWQWLSDLRGSLGERIAQYRLYRSTLAELEALSDRDLSDLGLHRSNLSSIARDAATGR